MLVEEVEEGNVGETEGSEDEYEKEAKETPSGELLMVRGC